MTLRDGQWKVNGTVSSAVLGRTSTGKEQLALTFDTDDEQDPQVTKYLFFTERALDMTMDTFKALGVDLAAADFRVDAIVNSDQLLGKQASLVLECETYNNITRTKVVFVNAAGGGGVKERMDPQQAAAFGGTLRDRLRRYAGVAQAPAKPATAPLRAPGPGGGAPAPGAATAAGKRAAAAPARRPAQARAAAPAGEPGDIDTGDVPF